MPKYNVSTFGRMYVVDEELSELPQTRINFMLITAILGFATLLKFLHHVTIRNRKQMPCTYQPLTSAAKRIIICYMISHIIHSVHFVDNIYRPVDYFEPKWLYDRYLISEMEITFFANFPITLSGLIFMQRFVTAASKRNLKQSAEACKKMWWYVFGSFLTVLHYRTEPPWSYSAFVNFTIAGEGISTLVLLIWLLRYRGKMMRKIKDGEESPENLYSMHSKSL